MKLQPIESNSKSQAAIFDLYVACFASGLSAQNIEPVSTQKYLELLMQHNLSYGCVSNHQVVAAILCAPLKTVENLPEKIVAQPSLQKSLYIAELMVYENFRGKGLGKLLINKVISSALAEGYTGIFIRVWDENEPALQLYKKAGFTEVDEILQTKHRPETNEEFAMRKVYLHLKLVD